MRDDDPIEIPPQDVLETLSSCPTVANQKGIEFGGTQAPVASKKLHQQPSRRSCTRAEVESEITQNECTTHPMKEGHFIFVGPPTEEDLIYLVTPLSRRFVREHCLECEIRPLALQPGRNPQTRRRLDFSHAARVQVMDPIRSHRKTYMAQRVELLSKFPVDRDGGMQQELSADEANHRHACSDRKPIERLWSLHHPEVLGQLLQRCTYISVDAHESVGAAAAQRIGV